MKAPIRQRRASDCEQPSAGDGVNRVPDSHHWARKEYAEMKNPRRFLGTTLITALVLVMGCGRNPLPKEDRGREFGKDAFAVIKEVDRADPSKFVVGGIVGIEDGKMTSSMPGAVFVVGVADNVLAGGKTFTSRQIIILTSKPEYILAPPGMTITIPGEVEILGKTYGPGKFTVPQDSKMPEVGCGKKKGAINTKDKESAGGAVSNDVVSAEEKGPTDANLKKLAGGMSLAEIEAIIGKGTQYSDFDLTKVRLGFSVKDPAAQRNTYVWLRPHDNSAYVVVLEEGKLMKSMTVYLPEK